MSDKHGQFLQVSFAKSLFICSYKSTISFKGSNIFFGGGGELSSDDFCVMRIPQCHVYM